MTQVDLNNPTLEFLDVDPAIAAQYGKSDSISYLMNSLADFLNIPESVVTLPLMFIFNFLITWVIVYCIYYRISRRRDYYTTFMLFSSAMFLLLWLMQILDIQTGFVLGLFAIFGMIRYRTETVPIREMTYLFIIIALSVINSLSLKADGLAWYQLLFANLMFIVLTGGFELWLDRKHESTKIVLYEKIENIVPEKREELIADLEKRIGVKVTDIEIGHVDFLRDVAYIKVTYPVKKGEHNSIDMITKFK
ncbi:MAG: DUF4956 domain-containing protein [Paludibacteraceae bacterium]|nr:DUF4956 domain-containing protein [Paludibacteraceae bacterium]